MSQPRTIAGTALAAAVAGGALLSWAYLELRSGAAATGVQVAVPALGAAVLLLAAVLLAFLPPRLGIAGTSGTPPARDGETKVPPAPGPRGIVETDRRGIVQCIDGCAEGIFGFSSAEVAGRSLFFLLPELAPNRRHGQEVSRFLHAGPGAGSVQVETSAYVKAQPPDAVTVRISSGEAAGGKQGGLLVEVSRAVPRFRPASGGSLVTGALAARVAAVLDSFVTVVSGHADLAAEIHGPAVAGDLQPIQEACDAALHVAAELRRFSPRPRPIEPAPLNETILAWAQDRLRVTSVLAPELPPVAADATGLRAILDGLFEQAASAPDGSLTLRTLRQGQFVILEAAIAAPGRLGRRDEWPPPDTASPDWPVPELPLLAVVHLVEMYGGACEVRTDAQGALVSARLPVHAPAPDGVI